jgi:hypothetical protein
VCKKNPDKPVKVPKVPKARKPKVPKAAQQNLQFDEMVARYANELLQYRWENVQGCLFSLSHLPLNLCDVQPWLCADQHAHLSASGCNLVDGSKHDDAAPKQAQIGRVSRGHPRRFSDQEIQNLSRRTERCLVVPSLGKWIAE